MSTTIFTGEFADTRRPTIPFHTLREAWMAFRRRREDRLALVRAGRLGPRLRADMGFADEPASATFGAGWDGLRPNGLLVRPRR